MDEACAVRCVETLEDRIEQHEGLLGSQRAELLHDIAQRASWHVLHCEVHVAIGLALVVDPHHVRVRQACSRLRLTLEPADEIGILRQMGVHDLEGNDSVKAQVDSLVHGGHSAASQHGANLIATVDDGADQASARRGLHLSESRCRDDSYWGVTRPRSPLIAVTIRSSTLP